MPEDVKLPPGYTLDPDEVKLPKGYTLESTPIPKDAGIRPQTLSDTFRENIGKYIPGFLPMAGGAVGAANPIPGLDAATAIGGTATGSALSYGLKKQFPQLFGAVPNSMLGSGESGPSEEIAKDLLGNEVLPRVGSMVMSGAFRKTPGIAHILETERVKENAAQLSDKFLKSPDGEVPPSMFSRGSRFTKAKSLDELDYLGQPRQSVVTTTKAGVSNPAAYTNYGQRDLNQAIYKGYSPSTGTIDATKILDELDKNGGEYTNIPASTKSDLKEFLTNVKDQKKLYKGESPYITYDKKRIAFNLTTMALGGGLGHLAGDAGMGTLAAGTLLVGNDVLAKILEQPMASHALIQLTKSSGGTAKPLLERILLNAAKGTNALLRTPDGQEQQVQIGEDGKVDPISLPR